MKKTEAKEKAKKILLDQIGIAYYSLENEDISDEDKELIIEYINQLGERACKAIGGKYVSY